MKNLLYLFLLFVVLLWGNTTIIAQVASGDFQYSATISDSLMAPTRLAIDQSGNVLVIDSYSKNIKKYDAAGTLLTIINPGCTPLSLAVNNNNKLFIGDAHTGNILMVDQNGTSSVFYSGTLFPNSMCFSPDNHLYIADSKLQRILVLDASGQLSQTIGQGNLIFPTGIAFDSKNNRVIVGEHGAIEDNLQTRIYIYALDGTLVNVLGSYGNSDGRFYRIQGISVGRCGNIYVCEPFQGNISVFTENGVFITKFGHFGTGQGELNIPMDVVFDDQERVLLASMNNGSLERFTIIDPLPSAKINNDYLSICTGETTDIPVHLTGTPPWSLTYTINDQNPITINNITSNPYLINASQPGIYKIAALSDPVYSGSCFSGSATIIEKPVPTAMVIGPVDQLCAGSTNQVPVQFTGSGPWELTYSINSQNPLTITNISANPYMFEVNLEGTYEITGVYGSECNGIVLPGNNIFQVHALPTAVFQGSNYFTCEGQSVEIPVYLTGNSPWSITYTINGQNAVTVTAGISPFYLSVNNPGNYQISALSDAFCTGNTTNIGVIVSINPKPLSVFSYQTNHSTISFLNNSQNATSYYWNFGDSRTSTLENPVHKYKFPGKYAVTLVASNQSCGKVKTTRIVIINKTHYLTPEIAKDDLNSDEWNLRDEFSVNIFPNPSNGLFSLEISNPAQSDLNIEITNVTGQVIYMNTVTFQSSQNELPVYSTSLDLSRFSNGIYTMKVITGEAAYTAKLVINK